jgi:hypothetical protein
LLLPLLLLLLLLLPLPLPQAGRFSRVPFHSKFVLFHCIVEFTAQRAYCATLLARL